MFIGSSYSYLWSVLDFHLGSFCPQQIHCGIQAGIELTREQDQAKAAEIEAWLELVASAYNVLPMDTAAFRHWARLMHRKSDTLYEDAIIAATARLHNLVVVTRNVADFKMLDVEVLNPFEASEH
jgi:toxin FitB